jgi:hypothetical protein
MKNVLLSFFSLSIYWCVFGSGFLFSLTFSFLGGLASHSLCMLSICFLRPVLDLNLLPHVSHDNGYVPLIHVSSLCISKFAFLLNLSLHF